MEREAYTVISPPGTGPLNGKYTDGGFVVSAEMLELASKPGYVTLEEGGQRLRDLYTDGAHAYLRIFLWMLVLIHVRRRNFLDLIGTMRFDPSRLSNFAWACFMGIDVDVAKVTVFLESHHEHDVYPQLKDDHSRRGTRYHWV